MRSNSDGISGKCARGDSEERLSTWSRKSPTTMWLAMCAAALESAASALRSALGSVSNPWMRGRHWRLSVRRRTSATTRLPSPTAGSSTDGRVCLPATATIWSATNSARAQGVYVAPFSFSGRTVAKRPREFRLADSRATSGARVVEAIRSTSQRTPVLFGGEAVVPPGVRGSATASSSARGSRRGGGRKGDPCGAGRSTGAGGTAPRHLAKVFGHGRAPPPAATARRGAARSSRFSQCGGRWPWCPGAGPGDDLTRSRRGVPLRSGVRLTLGR